MFRDYNKVLSVRIKRNEKITVKLIGRCMEPLLHEGDEVIITQPKSISIGKLYLFEMPGGDLGVHRLISKKTERLLMKGDRSKGYEEINENDIIGEVTSVKPQGYMNFCDNNYFNFEGVFISYLSNKHKKNKHEDHENTYFRVICEKLIVLYGMLKRSYWKALCQK